MTLRNSYGSSLKSTSMCWIKFNNLHSLLVMSLETFSANQISYFHKPKSWSTNASCHDVSCPTLLVLCGGQAPILLGSPQDDAPSLGQVLGEGVLKGKLLGTMRTSVSDGRDIVKVDHVANSCFLWKISYLGGCEDERGEDELFFSEALAWALWWRWSFWRVGKAREHGVQIKCFWCSCRRWRARALDDSKVEEQELHGHTLPQPEEDFSFGKCDLGRGGVLMNTTPIRKWWRCHLIIWKY